MKERRTRRTGGAVAERLARFGRPVGATALLSNKMKLI